MNASLGLFCAVAECPRSCHSGKQCIKVVSQEENMLAIRKGRPLCSLSTSVGAMVGASQKPEPLVVPIRIKTKNLSCDGNTE